MTPSPKAPVKASAKKRRQRIVKAMKMLEAVLLMHFPDRLDVMKATLAVVAVGCLKDNTQPTVLIVLGPSGAGKTLPLSFLTPKGENDPLARYFYRSDKFTAASFVSHRADLSTKLLSRNVDMLPRLKSKTLVTTELAPLFNGKRDELVERFSILTKILDGQGYISDSGAHGRRGYEEPINFQWLGATTPLSPEVLSVMANLGPRMLFFDADRPRRSVDELVTLVQQGSPEGGKSACQKAASTLVVALHKRYPRSSVPSSSITFPPALERVAALWATVLVTLRATLRHEGNGIYSVGAREHPERVLGILTNMARGSALVHGRRHVEAYDFALIGHIALSSGVAMRGKVLRVILGHAKPTVTTPEIMKALGVSAPTALRYMHELHTLELLKFHEGNPAHVRAREPFSELRAAPSLKPTGGEGGKVDA